MPLKLNQLKTNTDKGRKDRSENVHFKHVTTLIDKSKRFLREYVYETWTTPNNKYKTTIRPKLPKLYNLQNGNAAAVVSCSCPDFLYRCEYALKQSDNSTIKYSNGQPATITNPSNKKFLCKHLISILDDVFEKNRKNVEMFEKQRFNKPSFTEPSFTTPSFNKPSFKE